MRSSVTRLCSQCDNPIKDRHNKFCSAECFQQSKQIARIQQWLSGSWSGETEYGLSATIRNYLLVQAGYACSKCAWSKTNTTTGKVPLEINHIDGNALHNRPENLEVLCPNCHSLTSNYGNLNRGNSSRSYRYEGYELKNPNRSERPLEEKKAIQALLVEAGRPLNTWTANSICKCGKLMNKTSKQCRACATDLRRSEINQKSAAAKSLLLPSTTEILAKLDELGYAKYGREIGFEVYQIKDALEARGVVPPKVRKPPARCHCGKILPKGTKTCKEHQANRIEFPSNEELIAGVKRLGISKYARELGLPYPATLRKKLVREGLLELAKA